MRKNTLAALGAGVLFAALFVPASMNVAFAEIDVHINIGPPPISVPEPPALVMIPDTIIYFVPQVEYDVFYYEDYWWSPRGNQWYRATAYNGPWVIIENHAVPAPVSQVPGDYRQRYEKEQHIPYGQWKKQWHNQEKMERNEAKREKREDKQGKHGGGKGKKGD